ncbi:hypothetical protein GMD78_01275 [Ornithinibacillus sp. L9]|uniref:Uncharacterized protein n=1 Tax=Ornithinibacillus caprae TaxID=2678566 RepID=A0A6N8FBV3_9BACI|nr:DUF5702 domain-containing protein [Ornithinibacillus caprae]MUK87033.1 hypothetical protein [Ornithinibacillus caprae]
MRRFFKKIWHKFFINEHGAVSIYLIVVALLLLLFNAVLIDYARILVAERQTEEAAKTALRSTMSSYNTSLQNKGLFAFNGKQGEAENIFREVFQKNLSTGEGEQFNFLGLRPVEDEISLDIHLERSLANKDILKYQILEEMKYKAPVEVGLSLIKDFLSVSEQVEEASDYAKIAKELNDDAKEREELLDDAEELIQEAKDLLDSIHGEIHNPSSSTYPNVQVIEDIRRHHVKYTDDLDDIENAEQEEDEGSEEGESEGDEAEEIDVEELKERTRTFKNQSLSLLDDIIATSRNAVEKLEDALELIEEAEGINSDMLDKLEDHTNSGSSGDYDNAKDVSEELNESTVGDNTEGSLDDYVYDEELFTNLKDTVENAIQSLRVESGPRTDALITKLENDFRPAIETDFERNKGSIIRDIDFSREYHTNTTNKVEEAIDILENGRAEYKDAEDEITEKENEADEGMDESKDQLEEIEDAINNAAGAAGDNQKLAEMGQKANDYGEAIEANNQEFSMEDRDDTADEAMSFIDTLFKNLGNVLLTARDEVYINEYILMRFNSHDFDKSGFEANKFENNQVEYIIYGKELHGMNYFAALSEIFAVRFAINLAAGFMRPEARGFGPFIWAYAMAYSFGQTADNMVDLTSGRSISLYPGKRSPRMNYRDHLRLFLFAHPEGGKFDRLMAVLDDETGEDLRERSSYVSAEATASMRLWFLPQIIDLIDSTNIINGRVEGNKFFIEKDVNFSY